jgi:phosphoglycolate phosphatase
VDCALADFGAPAAGEDKVRAWVGSGQQVLMSRAINDANIEASELPNAVAAFRRHYETTACIGVRVYPGVVPLLDYLVSLAIPVAVVTNKPVEFVPQMLKTTGLDSYFSAMIGGECLPVRKPEPLPLLTMMAQWAAPNSASVMVGDSRNDLLAGKRCGVTTIAVTYGYAQGEDLSAYQPDWLGGNLATLI